MKMRIVAVDVLAATGFVSLLLAFVLLFTNAAYAQYAPCVNGRGAGAIACVTDPMGGCTLATEGQNCDTIHAQCTCKVNNRNKCVCAP
ncbi:MAG: hypothetical protein KatS3mg110_1469 [Pirellulaceae bacterium]|nr:MAG: hypothetical protein KatS3mg110_1469 [Pirellulaceae bacterium]